ncbi:hypothetical protein D9M72_255410 [compost metagenome]
MDQHRQARPHPVDVRPAAQKGDLGAVVCVRGADHRDREAVVAVRPHQQVLAGDFVPRILPEGVAQRRRLKDRQPGGRFLVGGSGTDEHVLAGPAGKLLDGGRGMLRGERNEVRHGVEGAAPQRLAHGRAVPDIGGDHFCAFRRGPAGRFPSVEDGQPVAQRDGVFCRRRADHAGSADEQDVRRRRNRSRKTHQA